MTSGVRRTSDIYEEKTSGEFIVRRRLPPLVQLAGLFAVCFTLLFAIAMNAAYLGGGVGVALAIFAIVGPLCWFTIHLNQRNNEIVMSAEFQNALFSAAARLKTRFCIIVKRDGSIFYYDRGFQNMFPEATNRGMLMLEKVFTSKYISPQEMRKLERALSNNESSTIFIDLPMDMSGTQKLVITVDPIDRPTGFFILRARDFVIKQYDRGGSGQADSNLPFFDNPRSTNHFYHMLQTLPVGMYATDPEGNFLFMNYTLENWLGYAQHEVVSKGLTLQDIVPDQINPLVEDLLLKDAQGPLTLQGKDRAPRNVFISQEITRDEHNAFIGTVAWVQETGIFSQPSTQADGRPPVKGDRRRNTSSPSF